MITVQLRQNSLLMCGCYKHIIWNCNLFKAPTIFFKLRKFSLQTWITKLMHPLIFVKERRLNETCEDDLQCSMVTTNSTCNKTTKLCTCNKGHLQMMNTCVHGNSGEFYFFLIYKQLHGVKFMVFNLIQTHSTIRIFRF